MKTLPILANFYITSNHAAIYAAEFCNDRGYNRIILVAKCTKTLPQNAVSCTLIK